MLMRYLETQGHGKLDQSTTVLIFEQYLNFLNSQKEYILNTWIYQHQLQVQKIIPLLHRMIQNPCFTADLTAGSQSNDPSSQVASEQIQGGETEILHFPRKNKNLFIFSIIGKREKLTLTCQTSSDHERN